MLYIISRKASKPAIASTARSLARLQSHKSMDIKRSPGVEEFDLSVQTLGSLLEGTEFVLLHWHHPDIYTGKHGLPAPEFMIIHSISPSTHNPTPIELHGFPPWQIRLTEIQ
jgi:dehydrodolichyl diphosphate syntase complex subunit NUS1